MKKWIGSLVAFMLVFLLAIPVHADSKGITVYYNGEKLDLAEPAFVERGKTYVQLRSYMEELDYEVRYQGSKKKIVLDYYGFESIIDLKTQQVIEDDEVIIEKLDLIYRNHTYYAPIRELEPVTLTTTTWDRATNSVYVDDDYSDLDDDYDVTIDYENVNNTPSEGFLWKVSKGENTVYLLGSIHVGNKDLYPLRDEIKQAYAASEILVTEVDMTQDVTEEELKAIEKLLVYEDGSKVKDHLSEETYNDLMKLAEQLGIQDEGLEELQTYRVWYTNNLLSSIFDEGSADLAYGIDYYFMNLADKEDLPSDQLESYLLQYNMLAGFSDSLQEKMLKETIQQYVDSMDGYDVSSSTDALLKIWREGDLESLTEIAKQTKEYSSEYYDGLLTKRNVGMADKIESYLNDTKYKTYFVIAGSLHFAGEDSIIALLEKRGYVVERL